MMSQLVSLQPLERAYLRVLRIRSAITWLGLATMAAVADAILNWRTAIPFGVSVVPIVASGVLAVVVLVPGRWRRWGYAFTETELHVAQGWLTQTHTVVPVARVQHIDVSQGPIERGAGVATLILHTAGTEGSLVRLPGISRQRAEDIRDAIRGRISDAPW